jgi:hypothetical protein
VTVRVDHLVAAALKRVRVMATVWVMAQHWVQSIVDRFSDRE